MSASFSIEVDPARDLVAIVMSGFFTPQDVAAFQAARDEAHRKLTCAPNNHVTLNDVREMKIQPQDAVAAFQQLLASPSHRSRRLAFVVAPTLARGQLMRAVTGRNARFFDNVKDAEAWLLAPEADQAAPLRAAG